ncbi:MAG: UDP-N-acetylmuramoyl-L-alanyl-D-glutamate--2,6-diaminopimelate ligase [Erysipelotrichaceae bacterium]|nr:UDP-N-acetylmuramoyl-L-alanyl-D-glutamate--2,6-diaminopimelate ligase [Erysipelotrichaceae bacterium]
MKEERCGFILGKMNLNKLLSHVGIACDDPRWILGMSDDTRDLKQDWLFICWKGEVHKQYQYIQEALKKGAIVLCDEQIKVDNVYKSKHLESIKNQLVDLFYQPYHGCLIAVTGTNGKSSVTHILKQMLEMQKQSVMTIGTGQIVYEQKHVEIQNTTPSMFVLAQYLEIAEQAHIPFVIMEVSSHGIDQQRILHLRFDIIIYTNITQDHLDYHLTRTHYQYTKYKLRFYLKKHGIIILNHDDIHLQELYHLTEHPCISIGAIQAHFPIQNIVLEEQLSSFDIHGYHFQTSLLSIANVYNITEAIAVCRHLGISYEECVNMVKALKPVEGRLICLPHKEYTVWIDYAHTFEAVKKLVEFAHSVGKGRVIIVVGCGGDREHEKRKQIGEYCAKMCDVAIFTTDNPRSEKAHHILQEMLVEGLAYVVIENRYYAIKHAINIAQKNDIIIIAGKGDERTQNICGTLYPFHDESCVYELWKREESL